MSRGMKVVSVGSVIGVLGIVGVFGVVAYPAFDDDLTTREVATLAQQDPTLAAADAVQRTVDGVGFPDWSKWGWKPTGGRIDHLDRDITTVVYEKGGKTIRYSVVAGTDPVNWDFNGRGVYRTPPEGKVELLVGAVDDSSTVEISGDCGGAPCRLASGLAHTIIRKISDHTVVLTATPPTDAVSKETQDMALRTKR